MKMISRRKAKVLSVLRHESWPWMLIFISMMLIARAFE